MSARFVPWEPILSRQCAHIRGARTALTRSGNAGVHRRHHSSGHVAHEPHPTYSHPAGI